MFNALFEIKNPMVPFDPLLRLVYTNTSFTSTLHFLDR